MLPRMGQGLASTGIGLPRAPKIRAKPLMVGKPSAMKAAMPRLKLPSMRTLLAGGMR